MAGVEAVCIVMVALEGSVLEATTNQLKELHHMYDESSIFAEINNSQVLNCLGHNVCEMS